MSSFEPLTPDRRRQQTREYLLKAAEQVFSERGFHGASLDEVAAVAGFTKGAVYSNFKNKEDLFLALLESRYEQNLESLQAALDPAEGPPETHLGDFARLIREQWEAGGSAWLMLDLEFLLYAVRNPAARERLAAFRRRDIDSVAELIRDARDQHEGPFSRPPEYEARIVTALLMGMSQLRLTSPELVDEDFLEKLMTFFYQAFAGGGAPNEAPAPGPAKRRG